MRYSCRASVEYDLKMHYKIHEKYIDEIQARAMYKDVRLKIANSSKGRNYSNHYATLLDWLTEDVGKAHNAAEKLKPSYDIGELEEINWLEDYA